MSLNKDFINLCFINYFTNRLMKFFEYFPSSNISPNNKYFFDLFDLILSKLRIADLRDNGFEL